MKKSNKEKVNFRTIKRIVTGRSTLDGAGVSLTRVFGNNDVYDFDPFLMLDAFDSKDPKEYINGFPWHPHRGIETITYLAEGDIEHGDSLGNKGSILNGDCQWMTAGSGIIHQEMPKSSKRLFGAQIWLNLPAKHKMAKPQYGGIKKKDIPVVRDDQATIRVIAGNYAGTKGAFAGKYVQATYLDVELLPESEWNIAISGEMNAFIYIMNGAAVFDQSQREIFKKHAILFEKGDAICVVTKKQGARFLLLYAKSLNEPIAWGGPIVMNTGKELDLAFEELENGRFIQDEK